MPTMSGPLPVSPDFTLHVDGRPTPVHHTPVASYALVPWDRPAQVTVSPAFTFERCEIRPLRHGKGVRKGEHICFDIREPMHLSIEFDGRLRQPLLLFADEPLPEPANPTRVFPPGVHDIGVATLHSGDRIHLAPGSVVRGAFHADHASDIAITGHGVLDGSAFPRGPGIKHKPNLLGFRRCTDVRVEGLTLIGAPTWDVVPRECQRVTFRNLKLVSWSDSDDGFDLVGCKDVLIDRCFARTKDDCVAIKACANQGFDVGCADVERIVVQGCAFWNAEWGNALEIGYETRCATMRDITFRDIDILHAEPERWTSGGVLTIHNGDRATVEDVRYENIRIEDAGHKLIDLKITLDRYSKDDQRGHIRRITFKDIAIVDGPLAPSIIQGYDADHIVRDVTIDHLTHHGQHVTTLLDAHLITERCRDIVMR